MLAQLQNQNITRQHNRLSIAIGNWRSSGVFYYASFEHAIRDMIMVKAERSMMLCTFVKFAFLLLCYNQPDQHQTTFAIASSQSHPIVRHHCYNTYVIRDWLEYFICTWFIFYLPKSNTMNLFVQGYIVYVNAHTYANGKWHLKGWIGGRLWALRNAICLATSKIVCTPFLRTTTILQTKTNGQ